jgi:hypothetical protein
MRPKPLQGTVPLPVDAVLLDMIRTNEWRRPLTFALTRGRADLGWLAPYARLDGLHWLIVPEVNVAANPAALRDNLLERFEYRGFADPDVRIEDFARPFGLLYLTALEEMVEAEMAGGISRASCREATERMFAMVPPERLGLPVETRARIEATCTA